MLLKALCGLIAFIGIELGMCMPSPVENSVPAPVLGDLAPIIPSIEIVSSTDYIPIDQGQVEQIIEATTSIERGGTEEDCYCGTAVRKWSKCQPPISPTEMVINIVAHQPNPAKGGWVLFKAIPPYHKEAGHAAYVNEVFPTPNGVFIEIWEKCFPTKDTKFNKRIIRADDPLIRNFYWTFECIK